MSPSWGVAYLNVPLPFLPPPIQEEASIAMKNVLNAIKLQDRGVYVQASTLGSLEALLEFLKQSKIPVSWLYCMQCVVCGGLGVLWVGVTDDISVFRGQHWSCAQERRHEGFRHARTRPPVRPHCIPYIAATLGCTFVCARWAVILAFDVRVERDAQEMADSVGVTVFSADIIYHLFDAFLKHREASIYNM